MEKDARLLDLSLGEIIDRAAKRGAREVLEQGGGSNGGGAEWLTVRAAAQATCMDKERIYDAVSTGELSSYRPTPRKILIDRAELDEWVRSHKSS